MTTTTINTNTLSGIVSLIARNNSDIFTKEFEPQVAPVSDSEVCDILSHSHELSGHEYTDLTFDYLDQVIIPTLLRQLINTISKRYKRPVFYEVDKVTGPLCACENVVRNGVSFQVRFVFDPSVPKWVLSVISKVGEV